VDSLPRFDLKGSVVMVTGAAGGLGSEIACACAAAGADILLAERDLAPLVPVAERIASLGRRAECLAFDLRDVSAVRTAAAEGWQRLGRIDGLVNCAGTNVYRLSLDVSEEEWDLIVDINLKGLFFLSQAVAREMVKRECPGRIVNIASSTSAFRGADQRAVYCASKGGVVQLTRTMAIELAPRGINVNAVAPTFTPTPLNRQMLDDPQRKAQILGSIPAGRLGTPMDTAAAVIFLLSEAAGFVNGHILAVDGGRLAM
jgi:2-dehydro-3-deoxy-D-gluconate 5-dehydrogenase